MKISRVYFYSLAMKNDIYLYKMKYTTHSPLILMHLTHGFKTKLKFGKELGRCESMWWSRKNTACVVRKLGFQSQLCYMSAVWSLAYKSFDLSVFSPIKWKRQFLLFTSSQGCGEVQRGHGTYENFHSWSLLHRPPSHLFLTSPAGSP